MAMTLRLPEALAAELREVAAEDHRSFHQAVVYAVESYLIQRETSEVKADADALRALAEARDAVRTGDVEYGPEAVYALIKRRNAS